MNNKNSNELAMEFFDNLNHRQILTSLSNKDIRYLTFSKHWKNPISDDLKRNIMIMLNTNKNLESILLFISSYLQKEVSQEVSQKKESEN